MSGPDQDLFGPVPKPPMRDATPVSVLLTHHPARDTTPAWFLSLGPRMADGKWVPKSLVSRGEGPNINVWTMPRWLARERGWL